MYIHRPGNSSTKELLGKEELAYTQTTTSNSK
jgi:hypothetical protein